ncbi:MULTISPECIES: hypothetical protein [unclassified Streptomyces]|uniref:hypothetical protein n=1 Tax=unclassified Streptomyces TaxID=2593676 RepID=UPI0033B1CAE7
MKLLLSEARNATTPAVSVGSWRRFIGAVSITPARSCCSSPPRRSGSGVAPTSETIEYAEHSFHKVRDGRFYEMNYLIDVEAVQRQLGM